MNAYQIRQIENSIAECNRFISKEEKRNPSLRPAEMTELLSFYISHKVTLQGMLK